ncbi:MAG: TCR/Tet family MFS transporter [Pseudomonadota bacterium]
MTTLNISLWIVLGTVMINMMGVGMMWPILPTLVEELTGGNVSDTAAIYGAIAVVFSLMQFLCAPVMGALSDKYGRRKVMLIALLGLGFDTLLLAFAPSILWVFIGRALGGVFGATYSIASAYVADTMEPEDRAAGFGMIGAAFGIGFIVGPLIGGYFGSIDTRMPFYFAAALSFLNFILGYFFLQETLPEEKRNSDSLKGANPFGTLSFITANQTLLLLGITLLLVNATQRGMETIWVIFTEHNYGWDVKEAGVSLAVVGISYFIVQGFLVRPTISALGEAKTAVIGLLLCAAMFLLLSFNTIPLVAYLGIPLYALGAGCAGPALQAIATRYADPNQQGHLQGALTSIGGIAAIGGPALSAASFSYFTAENAPIDFPGAYFLLGAIVFVITSLLATAIGRQMAKTG